METVFEVMARAGVAFGTSGARGLARDLTGPVCYAVTRAFLDHAAVDYDGPRTLAIAGDLRPSTPAIAAAVAHAAADAGWTPAWYGAVPTPALALAGMTAEIPSVMVTGSHIPDDRNGIKFYLPQGEILKADEAAIAARRVAVPAHAGAFDLPAEDPHAAALYVARWRDAFPPDTLRGMRLALYEHTAVGRDLTGTILEALGADVVRFGRSTRFVPVDTEAIRPEDVALAAAFAARERVDAIVSTDGDGDRPLVADEAGVFLRGDVAGVLAARALGIDVVVTPVSSNTVVERSGAFREVIRTRIGSPYVIDAMERAIAAGRGAVAGYEANGGFLLGTPVRIGSSGRTLAPLPTRDAVIVIVAVLAAARAAGAPLSALASTLPARFTSSDRAKEFPVALARERLGALADGGARAFEAALPDMGEVVAFDLTDGVRATFRSGEVMHFRPSGNAPELRCYAEGDTPERAAALVARGLALFASWRG